MAYRYSLITGMGFVILALSSCASFKQLASSPPGEIGAPDNRQSAASSEDITFIDDIALRPGGHSISHEGKAYHSPSLPAATGAAGADATRVKYAQLLDVSSSDIDNMRLYGFIDDWWGAPYRYGGESRSGIDCSAFVQALYAAVFGLTAIPRTAREQYEEARKIKKIKRLKEGDLVFFRIRSRHISHVGVYLQHNKFVHASLSAGVTISDLTDNYWKRYFVCGGELQ